MSQLPLYRCGRVVGHALVDEADLDHLSQWRWFMGGGSGAYVYRREGQRGATRKVYLHRHLLGLERGDRRQVDHRNRNPLDNRRDNLRIAVRAELDNGQNLGLRADNRSGFRGVSWDQGRQRWVAQARAGDKRFTRYFDTPQEADAAVRAFRAEHMPFSEDAEQLATAGFTP